MKISSKLMLSLITCVFMSQIVQPKSDKRSKSDQTIAPASSDKYEKELSFALSNYLRDLQASKDNQAIITQAMTRYENELAKIDQRYPDQVKIEAQERTAQLAAQRAKWHNYDVAYKALKDEFAKELAPYWNAQQSLAHASFNPTTRKDKTLMKKAMAVYDAAMQALQFQYRTELAKFNEKQQILDSKYNF